MNEYWPLKKKLEPKTWLSSSLVIPAGPRWLTVADASLFGPDPRPVAVLFPLFHEPTNELAAENWTLSLTAVLSRMNRSVAPPPVTLLMPFCAHEPHSQT